MLGHEEIKGLRPKDREAYIESVILRFLKQNPRGLTISHMLELTGFSRDTISKHLERLVAIREAYKIGKGVSIYYPNGKVVHEQNLRLVEGGNRTYAFYKLVNDDGDFLYIQEREVDEFRSVKVRGGIMVNAKYFKPFITALQNFVVEGEKTN